MTKQELFIVVVVAGLFYIVGQYIASSPQREEQEVAAQREITVSGDGKVMAIPDVAQLMLGVTTGPQATASRATELLSERFNAVVEAVEAEGVAEEDIQTTHISINPVYDFRDGQQVLRGFDATQSVEVKIRDLDSIGTVVSRAAQEGVNQAGGIQLIIDDPQELTREAEAEAIADAQAHAEALADELGVQLGRVKAFSAHGALPPRPPFFPTAELKELDARGGDLQVPTGTNEIAASVSITYELR